MRILKRILIVLVVLCGIFLVGGRLIPAEWQVSRSLSMQASASQIYPWISQFKKWESWSPWNASKDPSLKYTYAGPKAGVGAKQSWTSQKMGNGSMQFTAANPKTGVTYHLVLDMGHSQSTLDGNIAFSSEKNGTQVTWTDHGNAGNSLMQRWMSLLVKPMLGKDMDVGLTHLKALVEKQ